LAPPNRGSINSTHIHGTDVPVQEPSTASEADMPLPGTCKALSEGYPAGPDLGASCLDLAINLTVNGLLE
jgi:hypothetical protein